MNLYYYSFRQKKFAPLFPGNTDSEELRGINRYQNTSRGIIPLVWAAIWGVSAVAAYFGGGAALKTVGGTLMLALAELLFWGAGHFLVAMGFLLDNAINATISSNLYSSLTVITVGWTTVRDFSNMFFIFALLYIAIKTILGLGGGNTKHWVANLIIAAVLINFSLFATKVVVDAGNVLAMGFWEKMTVTVNGVTGPSASSHLMQGLKIQSTKDIKDSKGNAMKPEVGSEILVYLGGALVMVIAGYVFLAGAIMMIVRTVTLILLMIVSPFAFLGFGLPVGGGFSQKWLDKLISNTFVAPAFLAMLYIVIRIINSPDLKIVGDDNGAKWGGMFAGDAGSFPIIYNYLMIIILLLASLKVADAVSSGAGSHAGALAKKGMGAGAGMAFATGAAGLRQTVGRAGKNRLNDKKWVEEQNRLVAKGNFMQRNIASAKLASAQGANKATFDARNSKFVSKSLALGGVSAGAGTTRSYKTTGQVGGALTGAYRGTEKEKALIETAKGRFDSAEAQKVYLENKGVQLDAMRNKEVNTTLNRDIASADHKETLNTETKDAATVAKYNSDLAEKERLEAEKKTRAGTVPPTTLTTADEAKLVALIADIDKIDTKIATALANLTPKEIAENTAEFFKHNGVRKHLEGDDMQAIAKQAGENNSYNDPALLPAIAKYQMEHGTKSAKDYHRKAGKTGTSPFKVNLEADAQNAIKEYDDHVAAGTIDSAAPGGTKTHRTLINEKMGKTVGYMDSNDIADFDDDTLKHEAFARNIKPKTFNQAITKRKVEGSLDPSLVNSMAKNTIDPTSPAMVESGAVKSIIQSDHVTSVDSALLLNPRAIPHYNNATLTKLVKEYTDSGGVTPGKAFFTSLKSAIGDPAYDAVALANPEFQKARVYVASASTKAGNPFN